MTVHFSQRVRCGAQINTFVKVELDIPEGEGLDNTISFIISGAQNTDSIVVNSISGISVEALNLIGIMFIEAALTLKHNNIVSGSGINQVVSEVKK